MHQAGRLADAERLYEEILENDPRHADAQHLLGVLHTQTERTETAVAHIRGAIAANPGVADFHSNLGLALQANGDDDAAAAAFRYCLELQPDAHQVHSNLGAVLQRLGRLDEAIEAYRQAIALDPRFARAHYNLSTALKDSAKPEEAIIALRNAIAIEPNVPEMHAKLAGYLLESGDSNGALTACDAALRRPPPDRLALTFKAIALQRVGREDEAQRLSGLDDLIAAQRLQAPAGFADLADFHAALEHHILNHPTLRFEPADNATRNGRHTGNLLAEPKGPFAALETVLNRNIEHYLRELPADATHPYLDARPRRWRLSVWSVVMGRQGHQLPHTHPDGWVSGVYYIRLPDTVAGSRTREGWIEFGQPPPALLGSSTSAVRHFEPEEGLLLLFPSYVYHHTYPYDSDQTRISIAFDALPRF